MKIAGAGDDLGFVLRHTFDHVAPFAGHLEGCFNGFGAGVHGQHLVVASQFG